MAIQAQLSILRRWIPLFIVAVTTAAVAGYFLSTIQPKQYEAKSTLIVGTSLSGANPDYNQLLVSQRLSATYAAIATTHDVMAEVIAASVRDSLVSPQNGLPLGFLRKPLSQARLP